MIDTMRIGSRYQTGDDPTRSVMKSPVSTVIEAPAKAPRMAGSSVPSAIPANSAQRIAESEYRLTEMRRV